MTLQLALKPPSAVVTVMVEAPVSNAVTRPASVTMATEGTAEVQLTSLFEAFPGMTAALRGNVSPGASSNSVAVRLTPVTAIFSGTLLQDTKKIVSHDFRLVDTVHLRKFIIKFVSIVTAIA